MLTEQGLSESSARLVNPGDILYALYGATSGEVGISKIHGAINQAILAIRPLDTKDSLLISYWLRLHKESITGTYLQGGQGNLSGKIVKKFTIPIPKNNDEALKAGSFLHLIDSLIAVNQRLSSFWV